MLRIENPILPGFHPDPSILRVSNNFYIATSTFEWFPGVQIYHSKDLVNWDLVSRPLSRVSQLNLYGIPPSGGVWAPCLTYDSGLFYLIYTNTKVWIGANNEASGFKDTHNYLVTAKNIEGPWSEPVYLNSSGFDPSLFHDNDGRKWLVNMFWDYRVGRNPFAGIVLQEYDQKRKRLIGPVKNIFKGTDIRLTEGPHIYKRNGWYYLLTAEGGTSYEHAVTLARSRNLDGPYEVHPQNPLVTGVKDHASFKKSVQQGKNPMQHLHNGLQKAGHASICPWKDDEWIIAHLCGRPLPGSIYCPLGRETALQKVIWKDDDWLYLASDKPEIHVEFSGQAVEKKNKREFFTDFNEQELAPEFQTLRVPLNNKLSLTERKGYIRLYGGESLISPFYQTLIARRVQDFTFYAETCLEFTPANINTMAGLILRYDDNNQYYLRMSKNDEEKNSLGILVYDRRNFTMPVLPEIEVNTDKVYLAVQMIYEKIRFHYSVDKENWKAIGPILESKVLSDDYVNPLGFTGMFAGIACQDLNGTNCHADFDYFLYKEEQQFKI
ncbi:MAG: glycoside hydrolase family 43 protein [Spirochaetales bacterium]|nr:glycoside hydrolase family 43 protein [Spirochaetales bacterium]